MKNRQGQTAVITGAASGIGLALAREAFQRGMNLLLADLNATELQAVANGLKKAGQRVLTCLVDVADQADVQKLAALAFEEFGEVNLLFNNAGICPMGMAWDMRNQDWQRCLDVNLMGVVHGVNAFLPAMMRQQSPARIVNTGSIAGLSSNPGGLVYSVSKHAVVALSEGLHMDLDVVQSRVAVSVICPGFVDTNLASGGGATRDTPDSVRQGTEALKRTLAQGLAPDELAKRVFEGIEAGAFWIFPQPEALAGFDLRVRSIQQHSEPTFVPMLDEGDVSA